MILNGYEIWLVSLLIIFANQLTNVGSQTVALYLDIDS